MKIAVIAHVHFPIKEPYAGGLEAHTALLVRQLTKLGHNVTLYAKAGTKANAKVVPIFAGNARGGKNILLKIAYRYACSHILAGNYDLIFNNSLDSYPIEWHAASMPPMITVFHTPPFWELSDVIKQQPARQNRTYIAVSELTAGQWQPFVHETVHAVPNGIDMAQWPATLEAPAEESAFWMGRITPEKGTHIAIEAAKIAGIPLTVCGKIYDKKYFKTHIKKHIDGKNVIYKGHLSQAAVSDYMQHASVALTTPVWEEPFGLVAVEALASGVPVAGLNHGATASILKDTYGVLAASDSAEDLAKAIKAAHKIDRKQCADYAHDTYNVATMVEIYLTLVPQQKTNEEPVKWQTYA